MCIRDSRGPVRGEGQVGAAAQPRGLELLGGLGRGRRPRGRAGRRGTRRPGGPGGLARREPVAGLLLLPRLLPRRLSRRLPLRLSGGLSRALPRGPRRAQWRSGPQRVGLRARPRRGRRHGGGRRALLGVSARTLAVLAGTGAGLGRVVRDRRAHHDRRNGPRARDVDPNPGGQRGLGLRLLRLRCQGRFLCACADFVLRGMQRRILAGSVRRGPRRVRGATAPLGPRGRTVRFTAQCRFSQLAPPPVMTSCGRLGGAHHHTGRRTRALDVRRAAVASGGRVRGSTDRSPQSDVKRKTSRHLPSRAGDLSGCAAFGSVAHITAANIPPSRKT